MRQRTMEQIQYGADVDISGGGGGGGRRRRR